MDDYFEKGNSWSVFVSSDNIRSVLVDDWRWTKKLKPEKQGDVEGKGLLMAKSRSAIEDEKDAKRNWRKRPAYTLKRKISNVGIL